MQKNNAHFSVIMPIYNGEHYLKQAIESIIKQTYSEWELILVNDGSTDSSLAICKEYEQIDRRIIVLNKENSGVSDTRNCGLKQAVGEWIVFVDADDWFEESFLSKLKNKIDETSSDLFICNYYDAIETKKRCERSITIDKIEGDEINSVIDASLRQSQWHGKEWYGNLRTVWAKCFKHSIIQDNHLQFDSRLKIGEDMVFVLSYLQHVRHIDFLDQPLYNYRYNLSSVMHDKKWEGNKQGKLYFQLVEHIVGDSVLEGAKADLWLETAETDWSAIHCSSMSFVEKYKIFKKLVNDELYRRFAKKNSYEYSSIKQKLYAQLIRYKIVLPLLILSYYRILKHKDDLEKDLNK